MSEKKDRGDPKKLTVTSIGDLITSGDGKNGPWELHKIKALNAAGEPINEELKTFADVTPLIGKLEEYFVERDEREHNGRTYVSFLVTPKTSGMALKVEALTARVEQLERQVAQLAGGEAPASSPAPASPPPGGGSPATAEDDIPF